jgi:hypothetical protein
MIPFAAPPREAVPLNRRSFLSGAIEMIMLNGALREKYPTENFVFDLNYHPRASRFVPAPTPVPTANGQRVDTSTHLMCSKCGQWRPDDEFRKDAHRGVVRRGRRYYCSRCLSRNPVYLAADPDSAPPPIKRGRPKKKRR